MTRRIRLWIDPLLDDRYAAEIHWTWKLVLSTAGFTWERAADDEHADIVYTTRREASPAQSALMMFANVQRWAAPATARLASVRAFHEDDPPTEWFSAVFQGESRGDNPLSRTGSSGWRCERDLLFDVFWFLTRQEERSQPRGPHGQVELAESALVAGGALQTAVASSIVKRLELLIRASGQAAPVDRWPLGRKAAACASHDVDYPEIIRWLEPLRIIRRNGWGCAGAALAVAFGRHSHWKFDAWMEAERMLRTRSAFYFVPRRGSLWEYASGTPDPFYDVTSRRFGVVFRRLTDEGFEVGLHASYRAWENPERFLREKNLLERVSGQVIDGCRHHYWHLDPRRPETTMLLHERSGLKYDASIAHERYLGWRAGTNVPYFPFLEAEKRELATLQIPTGWMDDQLFGYRSRNPGDRQDLLHGLFRRVVADGGCLMIDVHDYVFDPVLFPKWAETYLEFWARIAGDPDVWIATPREIAAHWTARYRALEGQSTGL